MGSRLLPHVSDPQVLSVERRRQRECIDQKSNEVQVSCCWQFFRNSAGSAQRVDASTSLTNLLMPVKNSWTNNQNERRIGTVTCPPRSQQSTSTEGSRLFWP